MENKKQLVIVPPMSVPLQKLNEVLVAIAVDENIEISLIDDNKELNQFIGSAGQSLIVFSNAKKCATFLQENRFVLAKTHSKVILLTPKEIPPKTLIKFVKVGLTESILENSPPKTLLYKIKLLLRSIKSTSASLENKDQVVKSMLDTNSSAANKADAVSDKVDDEKVENVNYLADERPKNKADPLENSIDYSDNLKGKNNYQEDSIETNWSTKRKKDLESVLEQEKASKAKKEEDSSNIDMYYRGKKKNITQFEELEPSEALKKSSTGSDADDDSPYVKSKTHLMVELEIEDGKNGKKAYTEEIDDVLSLKKRQDTITLIDNEEESKSTPVFEAQQKESTPKNELEELEALFEEAKKRQRVEADDLGGHLKGKINNSIFDEEDQSASLEKKEYDNSDLYQKKKKTELDLNQGEDSKKRSQQNYEEDDQKTHDAQVDNINTSMTSEDGATDRINTVMIGEIEKSTSPLISENMTSDLTKNKHLNSDDIADLKKTKKNLLEENTDSAQELSPSPVYDKDDTSKHEKQTEVEFENITVDPTKKLGEDVSNDELAELRKKTGLSLVDGNDKDNKTNKAEDLADSHISLKKIDITDQNDENKNKKDSNGKVDKIDTYYRGGEAKKIDHNWDNLTGSKRPSSGAPEKSARRPDGTSQSQEKRDLGEQTIDYRQMKAEFDYIAKNGHSEELSPTRGGLSSLALIDSDDDNSKVIEVDARGFVFSVEILNLIYQKGTKSQDFYQLVSRELISQYKAYPIFYSYKPGDQSHSEVFDGILHFEDPLVPTELKEWWMNAKSEKDLLNYYFSKTMNTWLCREIPDSSNVGSFWEDIELPTWADSELTNKKVEFIFPYIDGVDRMGIAVLIMPEGIRSKNEKSILTTLELLRIVMLESIQRSLSSSGAKDEELPDSNTTGTKNIVNKFMGFFGKKKAS